METSKNDKNHVMTKGVIPPKVIVKFTSALSLPFSSNAGPYLESINYDPWLRLKAQFPGISLNPLVNEVSVAKINRLLARARMLNPDYRDPGFLKTFVITVPAGYAPSEIVNVLKAVKEVSGAAIERIVTSPSPTVASYDTNDNAVDQKYLDNAPLGISAKAVWNPTKAGSDGAGIGFIDIEKGWNLNHVDLAGHSGALIGTNPFPEDVAHGTRVLGVVCATDNDDYCIGIAPNLSAVNVVAFSGHPSISAAIIEAADHLKAGDVLLIEGQFLHSDYQGSGKDFLVPIEISPAVRDTILAVTTAGIIVVEPGGNGNGALTGFNFRDYLDPDGFQVLNQDNTVDFIDSGAIIVTAALADVSLTVPGKHEKIGWAPYGKRVDCYGWGEKIFTLDSDDPPTVNNLTTPAGSLFGGTSGAAAIIAGAVASIQGMVQAKAGCRFSPALMRSVIRNIANGTNLHITGGTTLLNIPMPDLLALFNASVSPLPALTLTMSKTDSTCFGADNGTATANAGGGTGSLTYAWSTDPVQTTPSVSGLAPGNYTVIVKDSAGCMRQGSVVISEPSELHGEVQTSLITCHLSANGSIRIINTSGGVSPYEFSKNSGSSWQPGNEFTPLGPGSYDLMMKDSNGCSKPLGNVILNDPAALNANVDHTDSTGPGLSDGTITISNTTGGYGTYQFSIADPEDWSDKKLYDHLPPGDYEVKMRDVTSIDCIKDLGIIHIDEPAPSFSVTHTVKDIEKFGDHTGEIKLIVTGGTLPYTFQWDNGETTQNISGLGAGLYTITATDAAGAVVTRAIQVRHIYFEIEKLPVNGLTLKFLKTLSWSITGKRIYKIKWKGRHHPRIIFHPHPHIILDHVRVEREGEVMENGVYWTITTVSVPVSYEGRIVIGPPVPIFPPIYRPILIPVKVWIIRNRLLPLYGKELLIGDFRLKIDNTIIDYTF